MSRKKTGIASAGLLLLIAMLTLRAEAQGVDARWVPPSVDADPAELVDMGHLRAGDTPRRRTAQFSADETPRMRLPVRSSDPLAKAAEVTVSWTVRDHPHNGSKVFEKASKVNVPGGEEVMVKQPLPLEKPGPYWVHVEVAAGEQTLGKDRLGILYDPGNYRPSLTRPKDFEQFWSRKLAAMRKIPFEPKLEENEAYATERYRGYDLRIKDFDGKPLDCVLLIPRAEGPYDAEVGGGKPGNAEGIKAGLAKARGQPVGVGMWQRGAARLRVGAPLPRSAEFTYWNGRDANNMLHCYLRTVRLTDYLRSREDVRHIWLFGASRSGPVMLAAAALAPEQVAAVNVHVPTSCGVSWKDRPYRGWGRPPSRTEEGLKTAAYFDPVNFAPDLEVPVVMDGGFYDGLSPIPGMLAFCNHATEAPFVRWSIEQGHHGYFTSGRRKELEADLAKHLAKHGIVPGQSDGQGDDTAAAD